MVQVDPLSQLCGQVSPTALFEHDSMARVRRLTLYNAPGCCVAGEGADWPGIQFEGRWAVINEGPSLRGVPQAGHPPIVPQEPSEIQAAGFARSVQMDVYFQCVANHQAL